MIHLWALLESWVDKHRFWTRWNFCHRSPRQHHFYTIERMDAGRIARYTRIEHFVRIQQLYLSKAATEQCFVWKINAHFIQQWFLCSIKLTVMNIGGRFGKCSSVLVLLTMTPVSGRPYIRLPTSWIMRAISGVLLLSSSFNHNAQGNDSQKQHKWTQFTLCKKNISRNVTKLLHAININTLNTSRHKIIIKKCIKSKSFCCPCTKLHIALYGRFFSFLLKHYYSMFIANRTRKLWQRKEKRIMWKNIKIQTCLTLIVLILAENK